MSPSQETRRISTSYYSNRRRPASPSRLAPVLLVALAASCLTTSLYAQGEPAPPVKITGPGDIVPPATPATKLPTDPTATDGPRVTSDPSAYPRTGGAPALSGNGAPLVPDPNAPPARGPMPQSPPAGGPHVGGPYAYPPQPNANAPFPRGRPPVPFSNPRLVAVSGRERIAGVFRGVPASMWRTVSIDTALFSDGDRYSSGSVRLGVMVPITKKWFFESSIPFGLTSIGGSASSPVLGNPLIGVAGVSRLGRLAWLRYGIQAGFPMVAEDAYRRSEIYEGPTVPNGLYNLHEFYPNSVPVRPHVSFEAFASKLIVIRAEVAVTGMIPTGDNDQFEIAIPHSVELQFGRVVGGGLRMQGVALPTFEGRGGVEFDLTRDDLYQLAAEPFFRLEQRNLSLRLGLMLPLDERLGPAFSTSYGFRTNVGLRW